MTPAIVITKHAAERYIERVDGRLTFEQAAETIRGHARAVAIAAAFGCRTLRLGNGAKLILEGITVVTVLPRGWINRSQEAEA